jgi:hypothetical protein
MPRFTSGILGGLRTSRSVAAKPFTIGRAERPLIVQRIIKAPHFVPSGTMKHLKSYAKEVLHDTKTHTKDEVTFARATLHPDQVLRSKETQTRYIRGAAASLVATEDRAVRNSYHLEHHADEVAGTILRGLQKEQTTPPPPTQAERMAAAGITPQQLMRPYQSAWKSGAETPATAPHAHDIHRLGGPTGSSLRFGQVHLPSAQPSHEHQQYFGMNSVAPANPTSEMGTAGSEQPIIQSEPSKTIEEPVE